MQYRIPCIWSTSGETTIEADSLEAAIKAAEDLNPGAMAKTEYIEGSFLVDVDLAQELNPSCQYIVDLPDETEGGAWNVVEIFATKQEAIDFSIKRYGADKDGNINLISEMEE